MTMLGVCGCGCEPIADGGQWAIGVAYRIGWGPFFEDATYLGTGLNGTPIVGSRGIAGVVYNLLPYGDYFADPIYTQMTLEAIWTDGSSASCSIVIDPTFADCVVTSTNSDGDYNSQTNVFAWPPTNLINMITPTSGITVAPPTSPPHGVSYTQTRNSAPNISLPFGVPDSGMSGVYANVDSAGTTSFQFTMPDYWTTDSHGNDIYVRGYTMTVTLGGAQPFKTYLDIALAACNQMTLLDPILNPTKLYSSGTGQRKLLSCKLEMAAPE